MKFRVWNSWHPSEGCVWYVLFRMSLMRTEARPSKGHNQPPVLEASHLPHLWTVPAVTFTCSVLQSVETLTVLCCVTLVSAAVIIIIVLPLVLICCVGVSGLQSSGMRKKLVVVARPDLFLCHPVTAKSIMYWCSIFNSVCYCPPAADATVIYKTNWPWPHLDLSWPWPWFTHIAPHSDAILVMAAASTSFQVSPIFHRSFFIA